MVTRQSAYEARLVHVHTPDIIRRYALVLEVLRRAKQRQKQSQAAKGVSPNAATQSSTVG